MSFNRFPLSMDRRLRNQKMSDYWADFETRLRAIPGVTEVGGGGTFPLNERGPFSNGLQRETNPLPPGEQPPQVDYRIVTTDYFKTLGQPLVSGRGFNNGDTLDAPGVVIINESAARHFWPNENPIGKSHLRRHERSQRADPADGRRGGRRHPAAVGPRAA